MLTDWHDQSADGVLDDSFPDVPPFPTNILTAPLIRLSLDRLRNCKEESDRLYSACKGLGFFYLELRHDEVGNRLLNEADQLFEVGKSLFELGREELGKYNYRALGSYYGYKGFGTAVVDDNGSLDRNEFYNVPKDDFLGVSEEPLAHPELLHQNAPLITSYIRDSHSLITLILQHLEGHMDLPPGALTSLHRPTAVSGDQVRFIKSPPQPKNDLRTSMGKHTDFGSITILFNRVGGLQVLPPRSSEWCYVKPLPGHCIINLGDAMVKFTNGLLRSNIHQVVAPPGEQVNCTRYSLVYFSRPEDEVHLKRLEGSNVIPPLREGYIEEDVSSKQWIKDKALSKMLGVYTGPGSFNPNRETAAEILAK